MGTGSRVTVFLVGVAAVFGLALVVGRMVGPIEVEASTDHGTAHTGKDEESGHRAAAPAQLPGLASSSAGYSMVLDEPIGVAGSGVPVAFRILGPDTRPVTDFEEVHEQRLHLIAVRRDTTGFQHVHPEQEAGGTWHTRLDLAPGTWRIFADFTAGGAEPLVLGADLSVPGKFEPAPVPAEDRTDSVDGYTVELSGDLRQGDGGELVLAVSKDGVPVTDLQPYLGAYGHLVALRSSDLAYLHVHPEGAPGDGGTEAGPEVAFHATAPSPGTYRLFLDFQHDGVVRTAEFTLDVVDGSTGDTHEHTH